MSVSANTHTRNYHRTQRVKQWYNGSKPSRQRFWCAHGAGDNVYFLPAVKALGGGEYYIYPRGDSFLSPDRVQSLCTLLEVQPYIMGCGWRPGLGTGINFSDVLDRHMRWGLNLTDMACGWLGLHHPPRDEPWLSVPERRFIAPVVVNRCPRWHNDGFPWRRVVEKYGRDAVFIGLLSEYEEFVYHFGMVSYHYTPSYLEAAQTIAGAQLFVGNQSCCAAIAEGLKQTMILETMPRSSFWWNCHFERPNKIHGYDGGVHLPDFADLPTLGRHRYTSETSRVRHLVLPYCQGYGCDIGAGGDRIVKTRCDHIGDPAGYAFCGDDPIDVPCRLDPDKPLGSVPQEDGRYDFVYSSHVIEDFKPTGPLLREFVRLVRDGGNLVLVFPDQRAYEEHCQANGAPANEHHRIPEMGLEYMLGELRGLEPDGIRAEILYTSDREILYNVIVAARIHKSVTVKAVN